LRIESNTKKARNKPRKSEYSSARAANRKKKGAGQNRKLKRNSAPANVTRRRQGKNKESLT